jgi:hypothetical protein
MVEPILVSPFFLDYILPFVLVFTLIFAILEKTNLLGEGKRQINAIIGLVIGLMLIAYPLARNIVVSLMPFLAVSAVILLVFMLLYGFIVGKDKDVLGKWWKVAWGGILTIALITVLLHITGQWDFVRELMFGRGAGQQIIINLLMLAAVVGVIVAVILGESGK